MIKLLVALQSDDKVLLQISEDDKNLAFICLEREAALAVAEQIKNLAERISVTLRETRFFS